MRQKKRIVSLLLCLVMLLTMVPFSAIASAATQEDADGTTVQFNYSDLVEKGLDPAKIDKHLYGDYNNDRVVSAADARIALRTSVGLETHLFPEQIFVMDIDQNGKVTSADARSILRMAVGLEEILEINVINSDSEKTVTVSFDSIGGSSVPPQTIGEGKNAVEPEAPQKDNYSFVSWYKDADYTEEFDFEESISTDITLFAKWEMTDKTADKDNDDVSDFFEEFFGSDPTKDDSDGDGLSDYAEIYLTATEPALSDTDNNGIIDAEEDADNDGLNNIKEVELGTDPLSSDSDGDGITDFEEVTSYKTNPLSIDTDNDGASDLWEIENGFDPNLFNDSFNTVITQTSDSNQVTLEIQLTGEQTESLSVQEVSDNVLIDKDVPGYIMPAYDFSVDGSFDSAKISFTFSEELTDSDDFLPVIYYYNESTQEFEELPTTVNGNVASASVTHFSTYILLNKVDFDKVWDAEIKPADYTGDSKTGIDIVFAIDSSGSMDWNDGSGLRREAVKKFIEKLGENDRAAVVDFDSYASVYQGFTSDHVLLNSAVDRIDDWGGTSLSAGMSTSIDLFTDSNYTRTDAYKYIVFLTDGDGDYYSSYTTSAFDNGIVVYTVGLGDDVQEYVLKEIAYGTGGKYFFASVADNLLDIYYDVSVETVDYATDSNSDNISDYFTKLLCDGTLKLGTGKNNPLYGISFEDIQADSDGDYDNDGLLNGQELIVTYDENLKRVYLKLESDPTLPDTDFDGIKDNKDTMKLSGTFTGTMKGYYDVNNAEYTLDLRQFFTSNTKFNSSLDSASLVFANTVYRSDFIYSKGHTGKVSDISDLLLLHGFEGVEDYDLKKVYNADQDRVYNDDDISEVGLGYQTINYNGQTKTIVPVIIRGTNGTVEEWSSNFDMGNPDSWKYPHHKGFYVTEERIRSYVNKYIQFHKLDPEKTVFWVTGHSRGAALANILAAKLIDEGKTVFAYTYATPSTTTDSSWNSAKYNSIFNFANTSDVVAYVPLSQWSFTRFGITKEMSIEDSSLEAKWCIATGQSEYNALNKSIIILALNRIAKSCAPSWKAIFDRAGAQNITDEQYSFISERAKRYCTIVERKSIFGNHKGYKLYPSTAFLFQLGAEGLGGVAKGTGELLKELWNSRYAAVIVLLLGDAVTNLDTIKNNAPSALNQALVGDGHAPATYYVLTHNPNNGGSMGGR